MVGLTGNGARDTDADTFTKMTSFRPLVADARG
jgi:hypothetical protein